MTGNGEFPLVLAASVILQASAAILALSLIPLSKKALAWLVLSTAFILMVLRRFVSLLTELDLVTITWHQQIDPEWIALIISAMLLIGILMIRTIFIRRNSTELALRESEERYALAAQGANDGLWDWNLKTGEVYFSERWKSMLGYARDEIGTRFDKIYELVHKDDVNQLKQTIAEHLSGQTTHIRVESRIRHREGHYLWVLNRGIAVRDKDGNATRVAGSQTDISARKKVEQQLLHDAMHDRLTDLPNRELFLESLSAAIATTKANPEYIFAVLFIDLDRFKVLNDSRGHSTGDQMLLTVSQRIKACMRDSDLVARLGGDEFTVLLEPIDNIEQAVQIADRIQESISTPINLDGHLTYTTASIGIAPSTHGYGLPEHILRDADTAMYHAKAKGKAQHQIFNPRMHDRAVELMQLETDLRHAIDHDEFTVHYQPIVSIRSGEICGMEALARWHHSRRGFVSPLSFIPLAEETGLIIPLGTKLLRLACQQYSEWKSQGIALNGIRLSVNVSSKQFAHPQFPEVLSAVLRDTGISEEELRIEVTESVLMENMAQAAAVLSRIKAMGISLHMDDFGTGYSSLSYLNKFPVDGLKIDRSFISDLASNAENEQIVRTIIALAHSLRVEVTAEGVEALEQLNLLRAMGCECAQGYYFAKPADAETIKRLLMKSTQDALLSLEDPR